VTDWAAIRGAAMDPNDLTWAAMDPVDLAWAAMDPATLAPAADCVAPLPPRTPNPSAATTGGETTQGKKVRVGEPLLHRNQAQGLHPP
jgi:hypothetical protein